MTEKNIKELSVDQLKALAWDCLETLELQKRNIDIINMELNTRKEQAAAQPQPPPKAKEPEGKLRKS